MKRCVHYLQILLAAMLLMASASTALAQVRVVDRLETDGNTAVAKPNLRIQPGDTIYLSEQVASGNQVTITVEAFTGSTVEDREVVTLYSVDPGTDVDTAGFITTSRRSDGASALAQAGDGTLQVRARNQIRFISSLSGTGPDTTLVAEHAHVSLVSAESASAPNAGGAAEIGTFRIGDRIYVRVVDDDRNQNPGAIDVIPPAVLNLRDTSNAARDETPALTETGPDTGVFIGSFPTTYVTSVGAATALNQLFEKTGSTPVEIIYTDLEIPSPTAVADPTITRQIPLQVGLPGAGVTAASPLAVGQPMQITVTDPNLNPQALNEGQSGEAPTQTVTVSVLARNAANVVVDVETVVLGAASATQYRGTVPWVFGNSPPTAGSENGVVNIPAGGNVYLAYGTPLGTNGQPFQGVSPTNPTVPSVSAGTIAFVTGADGAQVLGASQLVSPGDTLYVRIVDPGLVTRPVPGTNSVTVTFNASGRSNPQVAVAHEVSGAPGTFIAAIATTFANPLQSGITLQPDGTLHVRGNDTVSATYFDSGASVRTAGTAPRVATSGQVLIEEDTARGSTSLPVPTESGELRRIRAGDSFLVVVRDDDRNVSTSTRDTITVTVNVAGTGESETFTLTETDVDTGVFAARILTAFGLTANPAAGVVNVNSVPGTNAVLVEYADPLTPVVPTPPNIAPNRFVAFLDVESGTDGAPVVTPTVINPASVLTITVNDTDLRANARPGTGNDAVQIKVTALNQGGTKIDEETFDVAELVTTAAPGGGTFGTSMRVAFGGTALNNDGVLNVQHLGSIRTAYVDALRANGEAEAVVEVTNSTQFAGVAPTIAIVAGEDPSSPAVTQLEPGNTLFVRISDPDANLTAGPDTLSVNVFTGTVSGPIPPTQDSEVVMLRETGPTTGVFTGQIDTRYSVRGVFVVNGIVEARGLDINPVISVRYQSPNGSTPPHATVAVEGGMSGTIALSPATVSPGQRLILSITDTDVAANEHAGGGNDVVEVSIVSRASPGGPIIDTETFEISETGSSGSFAASVPTAFSYVPATGGAEDGVVTVVNGGTVQATYSDALRSTGAIDAPVSTSEQPVAPLNIPGQPSVTFVAQAGGGTPAVGPIDAGDVVYVEVVDANANLTDSSDTVVATVVTGTGGANQDSEVVTLRETGANTGRFVGSIVTRTARSGATAQNGQLEVRGQGPITPQLTASYDPPPVGGPLTSGAPLAVRPGSDGNISINAAALTPGQRITLTVTDADLAANQRAGAGDDSVHVIVTSRRPNGSVLDQETIDLEELAGGSAGQFGGAVQTSFSYGAPTATVNDGVVTVQSGGTVLASYQDALRSNGQVDVAVETAAIATIPAAGAAPTASFVTTLAGQIAATGPIEPGDTVYVEVNDPNSNVSESADSVNVTIVTGSGGAGQDSEIVRLTETAPASGRFTGSIVSRFAASGPVVQDGQLDARGRGITPSVVASFVNPSNGLPVTTAALAVRAGADASAPVVSPAGTITPGSILTFSVTDDDRGANQHQGPGNDTVRVTVTSRDATGTVVDEESLDATEQASALPGTFSIKAPTAFSFGTGHPGSVAANQNDGVVQVMSGGSVMVAYTDPLRANGDVDVPVQSSAAQVGAITANPTLQFRDGLEGTLAVTTIEPGDIVFVRVEDPNANLSQARDSVTVSISTGSSPDADVESLTLSETGSSTGVFTGFLRTKLGANASAAGVDVQVVHGNGQLEVRGRDAITGAYTSPSVFPTAAVVPVQVHTNAVIRFVQNSGSSNPPQEKFLRAGDHLFLQVVDDDANITPGVDKLTVTVRSRDINGNGFDSVLLELVESGPSTGIFVMAPGSRADAITAVGEIVNGTQSGLRTEDRADRLPVANDGILQVVGAARVSAEYSDSQRPAGAGIIRTAEELIVKQVVGSAQEARVRILPPGVGVESSATEVSGGDQFSVEVTDPNANRTARVDTVQITAQVTQGAGQAALDSETIVCTETGGDTGMFIGTIPTNFGPRVMSNAALTVAGSETITVSYGVIGREGGASTIFSKVLVTSQYSTKKTVSNVAADGTQLKLASGAQFSVPGNAVHRPVDLVFKQMFGKTEVNATMVDSAGNAVPAPLNPQVRLTRVAGRPFWFDIQPEGMHFRRPAELALPVPSDLQVVDPVTGVARAVTDAERNTSLRIVYFDGMDWIPVGGRYVGLGQGPDPSQNFVVASVNHLSMYALAVDTRPPPFVGGPLISEVTLDNTTFTPNGDGANDATTLSFGLAEASTVTVRIYDSSGEMVRTLIQDAAFSAGFGSTQWDGSYVFATRKVPAGNYIIEIKATTVTGTRTARESIMVGVMK